jgi:Chitobiase/beta-hexosaminidase C-terminal domain
MLSFIPHGRVKLLSKSLPVCLSLLTLITISPRAQGAVEAPLGIAWRVRGTWQGDDKSAPILTGDAVKPGSILRPGEGAANQSITVLLPDGQRILYECFSVEDCARGFRVPSLYRRPDPFAVDMLARIHAELARGHDDSFNRSSTQKAHPLPRDEVMAVLGPGNRVDVAGLAAKLSNGRYTCDMRPLNRAYPRRFHLLLEKTAPSLSIALPSAGIYVLTIWDALNTPRIDLFIAAVAPAQAASIESSFRNAKELMEQWNEDYQGWPIHDFQRAYLESLMLSVNAQPADRQAEAAGDIASSAALPGKLGDLPKDSTGVTAEPAFTPKPGLFDGDTAVTLRCNTPGATIHFTVDGSQPVANSPVYRAPIMVKGTELTIKSFAGVAGRKDSAVVTGIFRIQ